LCWKDAMPRSHPGPGEAPPRHIPVARIGDKLFAFDDLCAHAGCQLSAGILTGTTLMCPCHGSQFDVASGAAGHPIRDTALVWMLAGDVYPKAGLRGRGSASYLAWGLTV
jgi:nitrite reductase/ring-hydroxylating ferredoxin subunit